MNWSAIVRDARHGFRLLVNAPGFTAVSTLTVALGIGLSSAMFSVLDALLLKPLPYRDPASVLVIWNTWPQKGFPRLPLFNAQYVDIQRQSQVFTDVAGFKLQSANLTGRGEPERLDGARASASLFSILGVAPLRGRTFTASEDAKADRVVVLSYGLWQRSFAGNTAVMGRSVSLDGATYTVIGVMPPEFRFSMSVKLSKLTSPPVDLWLPLSMKPSDRAAWGSVSMYTLARLKPGVTIERALHETQSIARATFKAADLDLGMGTRVTPLPREVSGDLGNSLWILASAVGCVLLIACANLAGLLLARGASRRREIGVRMAIGASRGAILRQLLVEALLLSCCGGLLGFVTSTWLARMFLLIGPEQLEHLAHPAMDYRILLFALAVSVLTGLLFGIAPARELSNTDVNTALNQSGRTSTSRYSEAVRAALVIAQLSVAVVVVAAAMLLARSLVRVLANDPGFARHNVLAMDIPLPASRYPDGRTQSEFFERALQRVQALPGVVDAAVVETASLTESPERFIQIEDEPVASVGQLPLATTRFASPDYLRVTGIPLLMGRWLSNSDRRNQPGVAVADQSFANAHWAGRTPIGKHIRVGGGATGPWITIVGVVGATRQYSLDTDPRPGLYLSYLQDARSKMSLLVRTQGDPLNLAGEIRQAIHSVDRDQPVAAVRTIDELVTQSVANRNFETALLTTFAGSALLLASLGLFGLLSWSVAQRAREIGVRLALGATSSDVLWMVTRRAMMLTGAGVLIGGAGALAATRVLQSLLYKVSPTDPVTLGGVAVAMLTVAAAASALPARRALRVDPAQILRTE
ncbi:MAG: ABC transporter permease [Acidobacteriaceae bacterium]|nr:ABC transporter permease [Acidobacteriaceae bacterium]